MPWSLVLYICSTAHLAGSGWDHSTICSCICITGSATDTSWYHSHKASKWPCKTTCQCGYPTCGIALGTGMGLAGLLLSCLSSELGGLSCDCAPLLWHFSRNLPQATRMYDEYDPLAQSRAIGGKILLSTSFLESAIQQVSQREAGDWK